MIVELATGLLMIASAFSPASASMTGGDREVVGVGNSATEATDHPVTLESYVRDYFSDAPILAEIARCESSFRQHGPDGSVLRGKVNKGDIGIMQINKYYHEEDAEKLGFDIYTLEGNLGYAKWLYGKYESDPWVHSSRCWKNNPHVALAK